MCRVLSRNQLPTPTVEGASHPTRARARSLTSCVDLSRQEMNEIQNDPVEGIDAAPVRMSGIVVARHGWADAWWTSFAHSRFDRSFKRRADRVLGRRGTGYGVRAKATPLHVSAARSPRVATRPLSLSHRTLRLPPLGRAFMLYLRLGARLRTRWMATCTTGKR